ncbi:MAG: TMEM175 family protein [Ferruginibacter sp.]
MSHPQSELQKEFELERMILFSDAVFAIAITLLIIEIKFPEVHKGASAHEIWLDFAPVLIRFIGFILSFFFIGLQWARHLKIFKYLQSYNNGVILINLIFLFFIVCFPFTASGLTEHIRPGFLLPIFIYIINVACVVIAQYALCRYMFKTKTKLTFPGFEKEKKYMMLQSKYGAIMLIITIAITISLSTVFSGNVSYTLYGFYFLPISMVFVKKYLKKYKPANTPE